MSKASVLALVQTLSNGQADAATCDRYYDEIVLDLAQLPILLNATLLDVSPGRESDPDSSFELPVNAVVPFQFCYDDSILPELNNDELLGFDRDWRALRGRPIGVYRLGLGLRRFRYMPLPDSPSGTPFIFGFGAPFGPDFPGQIGTVIHSETRTNVPQWLEPAITWFILSREFTRDSDHFNPTFAGRCAALAQAELEMVR